MLLSNEPGGQHLITGSLRKQPLLPSPLSLARSGQGDRATKGRDLDLRYPFGASTAKQQGVRARGGSRMMGKLHGTQRVLTKMLLPTQGHS